MSFSLKKLSFLLLLVISPTVLFASGGGGAEHVPMVLLGLVVLFLGAKIGGVLAIKYSLPIVLGELLMGILLGNLMLLGVPGFEFIKESDIFLIFAEIGVILLLFEVGLESSMKEMLKVGPVALLVAVIGVIVPFILGYGVSWLFMPEKSPYIHAFIGATLCATSVGITARVLKDLDKLQLKESKIILGAAVIDDVLGLIILAVIQGVIISADTGGGSISVFEIFQIAFKAVSFLVVALLLGGKISPSLFKFGARSKITGSLISVSLSFCFMLAYLSHLVGLAPIVGAFAAGLLVDGHGYAKFYGQEDTVEALIFPISKFFVPIFFVHMGMGVNLAAFSSYSVVLLGLALSFVAILGKQACALGVFGNENKSLSKILIGIGMIPRGEVGLIFAGIGAKLMLDGSPVIDDNLYAAIIMMVLLTTLVTPPLLKIVIDKKEAKSA